VRYSCEEVNVPTCSIAASVSQRLLSGPECRDRFGIGQRRRWQRSVRGKAWLASQPTGPRRWAHRAPFGRV